MGAIIKEPQVKTEKVTITPPNMQVAEFEVVGTAPYVQNAFSTKTREQMAAKQAAGEKGGKAKRGNRAAKDFDACAHEATHWLPDGTPGVPASGIRASLISACRVAGFKMTIAKLSVFVLQDGFSADGIPLVRLHGAYERFDAYVRNETGVPDVRARNMWRDWHLRLRIRYDADQFSIADVSNLLMRAGMQVGWGEGRPDSKKSLAGMGWGTFELKQSEP